MGLVAGLTTNVTRSRACLILPWILLGAAEVPGDPAPPDLAGPEGVAAGLEVEGVTAEVTDPSSAQEILRSTKIV